MLLHFMSPKIPPKVCAQSLIVGPCVVSMFLVKYWMVGPFILIPVSMLGFLSICLVGGFEW